MWVFFSQLYENNILRKSWFVNNVKKTFFLKLFLQRPLHPQQIAAWFILAYFTIYAFGILIPSCHTNVQVSCLKI
jgi:hypothetical protein